MNLLNFFKKKRQINVGDIGIYHDSITYFNRNESSDAVKYNIYVKVKVVAIYDALLEVELMETNLSESVHPCIMELVKTNLSKYVNPKYIKWFKE